MKKVVLLLAMLLIPFLAQAQETPESLNLSDLFKKIPNVRQGAAYDVADHKINYLSTIDVLSWHDLSLSVGYSSDDKAVGTISYDIGGLKKIGLDTPITNLIDLRVGAYVGYGRITGSNEFTWGPEVTIVSVKF